MATVALAEGAMAGTTMMTRKMNESSTVSTFSKMLGKSAPV